MPASYLTKASLCLLLLLPGKAAVSSFSNVPPNPACADIEVSVNLKSAPSDPQKQIAEATVTGATKPIHYIFYKASGRPLSSDLTLNRTGELASGEYYLTIVDGNGCNKKVGFKIE